MDIAITGASGHIGGVLVRDLLQAGHRVRALSHGGDGRALEGLDVTTHRGDVRDPASLDKLLDGAEVAFHLAAQIWIGAHDDPRVPDVNVTGTRNVLAAVRRAGVRRLVHFSSIHAVTPPRDGGVTDEGSPLLDDPRQPLYDRTKATAQREVQAAARDGLDVVMVNPCGVVGPYDFRPSRMGRMLLDLQARRLPALVDGGFHWVDVRDVAQAAVAAMERGRRGEHYLLGGAWSSVSALAALARDVTGVAPPRMVTPMWLARAVAPVAGRASRLLGREGQFTAASIHALRIHRSVSSRKAQEELGFRPRPLAESLADAYRWFKEDGRLR